MVLLWAWVYCVYALVPSWKFYCKLSETCLKYNLIPQHIAFYRYGIEIITNFESDWLAKILIFFTSPSVTARWDYTCGKHTVFKPKNAAIPKLVSWQVLRSLWCLEKRAMTGHSCGYGFCPIWGCELNWIGFVSKWTMWLFWKVAQDTGSKFFPKTVPQCNSMNETHSGVYYPAWGYARHLIGVLSNCIVGLF